MNNNISTLRQKLYKIPSKYLQDLVKSDYATSNLQRLSDDIRSYLKIPNRVLITFGKESSDYMLTTSGISDKEARSVGYYTVKAGPNREINITKKLRFKKEHIMAILVHEHAHNFLYHYGIFEPEESKNEILTDIASAYIGLGHLIASGYEPISWEENKPSLFGQEITSHNIKIGYVSPGTIRRAIIYSIELRNWSPEDIIAEVNFTFLEKRKIKRIIKQKKMTVGKIDEVQKEIEEIELKYAYIKKTMSHISTNPELISKVIPKEGKVLVELANKIVSGEIELEINLIKESSQKIKGDKEYDLSITDNLSNKTQFLNQVMTAE